jgi:hypothetical protein
MQYLALAVEYAQKACNWRQIGRLLPPLLRAVDRGAETALRATDPYEALLYLEAPSAGLDVARQHVADHKASVRQLASRYRLRVIGIPDRNG